MNLLLAFTDMLVTSYVRYTVRRKRGGTSKSRFAGPPPPRWKKKNVFLESSQKVGSRSTGCELGYAWLQVEINQVGDISGYLQYLTLILEKLYLDSKRINPEKKKTGVRSVPTRISSGAVLYNMFIPFIAVLQKPFLFRSGVDFRRPIAEVAGSTPGVCFFFFSNFFNFKND